MILVCSICGGLCLLKRRRESNFRSFGGDINTEVLLNVELHSYSRALGLKQDPWSVIAVEASLKGSALVVQQPRLQESASNMTWTSSVPELWHRVLLYHLSAWHVVCRRTSC